MGALRILRGRGAQSGLRHRRGEAFKVTTPKSDAGVRDVAIPPHLLPALEAHLEQARGAVVVSVVVVHDSGDETDTDP